jgi:hypothetical protein
MKELTAAEASLVQNSPAGVRKMVHEAMWPEMYRTARLVVKHPRKFKKVVVKNIPAVLKCVEEIGGVAPLLAIRDVDQRKVTQTHLRNYSTPVNIFDEDGNLKTGEELVAEIANCPSVSLVCRDTVLRVSPETRVVMLKHALEMPIESLDYSTRYAYQTVRAQLCGLAADGEIDRSSLTLDQSLQVLLTARRAISLFGADVAVYGIFEHSDRAVRDTCLTSLGNQYDASVEAAVLVRWRAGDGGAERELLGGILGSKNLLTHQELSAVAGSTLNATTASLIVNSLPLEDVRAFVGGIPADMELPDTASVLSNSAGLDIETLCQVVAISRPRDVVIWLRSDRNLAATRGTRGERVARTIIERWSTEKIESIARTLADYATNASRTDIAELAVHAPLADIWLAGSGYAGEVARRYVYEALGDSSSGWDFLRGILPSWKGSVHQLTRTALKMSQPR